MLTANRFYSAGIKDGGLLIKKECAWNIFSHNPITPSSPNRTKNTIVYIRHLRCNPISRGREQLWFHEAQIYVISKLVFVNKFKKMGGFSADRRARSALQRSVWDIWFLRWLLFFYYWKNTPVGNGIQYHAVKWHVAQFHYRTHKTRTLILRPLGTCQRVASFGE